MTVCEGCGAASAAGAPRCAACGRSFAIGEVEFGGGGLTAPSQQGSWGAGVVVEPSRRPAVLRWFVEADWRPALRVVAGPTALLLVAALLLAFGLDSGVSTGFGTRFGVGLAVVPAAFGGPVTTGSQIGGGSFAPELVSRVQVLPMTVTLLWVLAFGLGLRADRRRLAPGQTGRELFARAARPVLLAVLAIALLGLLAGADDSPGRPSGTGAGTEAGAGLLGWLFSYGYADHVVVSAGTGWAVLGTALLAGLTAAAVYGADNWRRLAGGWAASGAAAGRALLGSVGAAALVALLLAGARLPLEVTLVGLAVLPNAGLALLGFGSGATAGFRTERSGMAGYDLRTAENDGFSLFDLGGQSGHWRWTVLLALAGAALLGWTVRRFDLAGRVRAAGLYWAGASLLTAVGGMVQQSSFRLPGPPGRELGSEARELAELTSRTTLGLTLGSVLLAQLCWTVLGAFVLPALLGRRRGRPAAAPVTPGQGAGPGPVVVPPRPTAAPVEVPRQPPHLPFAGEVLDSHASDR
ncbi:hypothetical protein ACIRPK_12500 [Kitasatospora sp. NPDC101801]|uniref:hypothetical protein n=1 Tax=Kitasatospora sp. NPDC101801 TaxID=3364103 RepID=UPI0037F6E4EC